MARPRKRGLDYFPMDVDFYDNIKIMTLLNDFGPLGTAVYEVVLSYVYHDNGYYLEAPMEYLIMHITRKIGSRWISSTETVREILCRCAQLELFDPILFGQGVITSKGIQRRYAEVVARKRIEHSKYWLLDTTDEQEILHENPHSDVINTSNTGVSAAETPHFAAEMQQSKAKQTKQNETKQNESKAEQSKPDMGSGTSDLAADTLSECSPSGCCDAVAADSTAVSGCADDCCCSAAHREFEKIKLLNPADFQRITELNCHYGEQQVILAMRDARRKGGRSLAYVERILSDAGPARQGSAQPPPGQGVPAPPGYDAQCSLSGVELMMYDEWFGEELSC